MEKSKVLAKHRGKKKRIRKGKDRDVVTDPRFSKLHSDPRFARFPAQKRKVKIDERFSAVFSDPSFKDGAQIDKWGRKVDTSKQNEEMERLYQRNDNKDEKSVVADKAKTTDAEVGQAAKKPAKRMGGPPNSKRKPEGKDPTLTQEEIQHRAEQVARMRGMLGGSSSEEMDSADEPLTDEEEVDNSDEVKLWGVGAYAGNPDENVPDGEATRRLAVVDLDWESIRAVDILNVMRSFLPTGGRIDKVSVLVSEYGKERMAAEDAKGPGALGVFGRPELDETDEDPNSQPRGKKRRRVNGEEEEEEEGVGEMDMERVRKYERSKLRYYYAVVDCASVEAAAHLVQELDGREFETSQCMFDMRYIPDDMGFESNDCRDWATEVPADYEPPKFECNALTKTNVKLTWDDDDKERKKVVRRKFTDDDLLDEDFKVYLASGSEHDSDEGEGEDVDAIRERYKNLFGNFGENSNESDSSSSSSGSSDSDSKEGADKNDSDGGGSSSMELEEISDDEMEDGEENAETVDFDSLEEQGEDFFETGEIDKEISFHVSENQAREKEEIESDESSDDNETQIDPPQTSIRRNKSKKRMVKDTANVDGKSEADLELLLLDDNALKAARKGGAMLEGKAGTRGKGQKLSKKERIRLAKLRKEMGKQGSDEEDANDKDFQVDLSDSRFKGMFTSSEFAIDPTHPAYQRSRGAADMMKEVARTKSKKPKHPKEADIEHPGMEENTARKEGDLKSMAEKLKRKSKLTATKNVPGRTNKGGRSKDKA